VTIDVSSPFYDLEVAARLGQTAGQDTCRSSYPKCAKSYDDILNECIEPLLR
jgi:DhnA family fructose-bisphosphate aldolase class Ia